MKHDVLVNKYQYQDFLLIWCQFCHVFKFCIYCQYSLFFIRGYLGVKTKKTLKIDCMLGVTIVMVNEAKDKKNCKIYPILKTYDKVLPTYLSYQRFI